MVGLNDPPGLAILQDYILVDVLVPTAETLPSHTDVCSLFNVVSQTSAAAATSVLFLLRTPYRANWHPDPEFVPHNKPHHMTMARRSVLCYGVHKNAENSEQALRL